MEEPVIDKVEENRIRKVFVWSIAIKGINAVVEVIVGISLIFISPNIVTKIAVILTQGELIEDPDSAVANYILSLAHNFSVNSHTFLIWYLLIHGIIKVFLITALLYDKKWSYPLALVVLGVFTAYQLVQYFYTPGLWLLLLTLFDLFIIGLIYNEHRYGRKIRGVL